MNPRPTSICHFSFDSETDLIGAPFTALTDRKAIKLKVQLAKRMIALFPGEFWRDPKRDYLLSCHHDAPWDMPELINAFLVGILPLLSTHYPIRSSPFRQTTPHRRLRRRWYRLSRRCNPSSPDTQAR